MSDNNNEVIYGTDLLLLVEITAGNWQPFAHAQSHSLDVTRDTYQVTSKSTGEWIFNRYGKISWSGSLEGLAIYDPAVFNFEQVLDMQIARSNIKIISVLNDPANDTPLSDVKADYDPSSTADVIDNPFKTGTPYYEGEAVVSNVSKTAGEGDNATFSISFDGATKLEKKTVATVA